MGENKNFLIYLGGLLIISLLLPVSVTGQTTKEQSFNIISYNIRMNTPADGENAWPLRKDKVAGLLSFHKADIFTVQEALPEQMDDLFTFFPEFDHVGVGRDDGKRAGEHMAIFYKRERFEKISDGMFWINEATDKPGLSWDACCNRTVTWIRLKDKLTGKSFLLYNTHFDNRGVKAREEGAKMVLKSISEVNADNLPLILTGDFNLVKTSEPIQSILTKLDDAMERSLSGHYGPEGTSGGFDVKVLPRKIDFIFVNDAVTVLRHGHLSDSFGLFYPSDHLPVLVEILIM